MIYCDLNDTSHIYYDQKIPTGVRVKNLFDTLRLSETAFEYLFRRWG